MSLVLLDWSVRESFHLLYYLGKQTVDRDEFEVVFIEYYSREAEPLKPFAEQVDTWVLLEMPEACIYHKHLMYNCGIIFCRGESVVICDSDAMVKDSFIHTIILEFEKNDRIVLHLDQFRNSRKEFYPFNYPSFGEVLGDGCINNIGGKTKGILDTVDPLHSRNYGACMCARRADLIAIGGADEHLDYLGHICGPYEMTFRLVNYGLDEIWHEGEYLYHTWHPGQAGVDNYQGPHDGRQMSSTALEALILKRVWPLVENRAIQLLRKQEGMSSEVIEGALINQQYIHDWDRATVKKLRRNGLGDTRAPVHLYRGFKIVPVGERYYALPQVVFYLQNGDHKQSHLFLESSSLLGIRECIDRVHPNVLRFSEMLNFVLSVCRIFASSTVFRIVKTVARIRQRPESDIYAGQKRNSRVPKEKLSFIKSFAWFYQKHKTNWLATKHYLKYTTQWIDDLIANLYFIKRLDQILEVPPTLLTTSVHVQIYLSLLMRVKVLPPLVIVRLRDRNEVRSFFEALSRECQSKGLILARDLYTRHYGLIRSYPQSKDALII